MKPSTYIQAITPVVIRQYRVRTIVIFFFFFGRLSWRRSVREKATDTQVCKQALL